jgi:NADH-quinone oxidoreductase subunit N
MNFTFSYLELMPLAPVMVVAVTAVLGMLLIALKRDHTLVATFAVIGLNLAAGLILRNLWVGLPPSNIMGLFTVDPFAQVYMLLILVSALACCTFSHAYIDSFKDHREELYILLLASVTGAMLMVASTHYASFFISLETMSIPIYGMLAYTYQREKSLEAGVKYLVLSATASAMLLMGFAYLYAYTGELSFMQSAMKIVQVVHEPLVVMGLALVVFACAFKLSLAPFHKWTPDVYQGAPTPMATFLASAAKVAMLGLLLRYVLTSGTLVLDGMMLLFTILAVLSIVCGNLLAVTQVNLKRILAFSSIAHFGYLLVALVSTDVASVSTITVYIATYVLSTLGAFGTISLMSSPYNNQSEAESTAEYRGLFWRRPVLTVILTVMMLSLAGIPTTVGFIGKFVVVMAAVAGQHWFLAGMIILGSGIGLYYYLRVMVVMYMTPPRVPRIDAQHNWGQSAAGVVLFIVALLVILLGVYPQPLLDLAAYAHIAVVS